MEKTEMGAPPRGAERTHSGLIGLVVRRPVAVLMVVMAVAVFGLVSLQELPVTLLPDISYPTLTVRTEYDGAAPSEVEKLVTRPLEENLAVIGGLVGYRSISRAGVSDVILEFAWATPMTFATQDVREKVDQIKARLPREVEHPLILRYDPTLDPILRLALYTKTDEGPDLYELRRSAEEELRRQLESLPGVAAVRVRGGYEEEWRIELEEDRLKLRGVTAADVIERVALENANVAGGLLRDGDRESLVRTLGEITTLDELQDLVVAVRGGEPVRVRDVGTAIQDKKDRDVITRIEGRESVEIEIFKEAGANVVEVAQAVKTRIYGKNWRGTLVNGEYDATREPIEKEKAPGGGKPGSGSGGQGGTRAGGGAPVFASGNKPLAALLAGNGMSMRLLSDQSVFIESSIAEVRDAALLGAALAVLVLFLFLRRLSPTAIIGVTIPISVVATFAPMHLAGVSLNIMSLGGLALGIGMLVDSAIVVLESISRKRDLGADPVDAAVLGTREVGLAVVASTLTTVAVFLPMVFVEGIAGEFFRDQALAVVFSLLAALVAAIFFIPMLASRRVHVHGLTGPERRALIRKSLPWSLRDFVSIRAVRSGPRWLIPFELFIRFPLEVLGRSLLFVVGTMVAVIALVVVTLFRVVRLACTPLLFAFDRGYGGLERTYQVILSLALRARPLVVALMVVLGWLAYTRIANLGVELVPQVHQGEFTVETQLDVGTPVATTDRVSLDVAARIRHALDGVGIPLVATSTSAGVPRDVIAKAGEGQHTSKVHVRLGAKEDLDVVEERAKTAIREQFSAVAGAAPPIFVHPSLFTTKTSLEVEIVGAEMTSIRRAADVLEAEMARLPGITDVQSTNRAGHPELVIRPDREQLVLHKLNAGQIANLVRDKVQGQVSTRVSRGDRKIDVVVRSPREDVNERAEILNLRVASDGSDSIPLSTVATIEQRPGPAEIRRVGGERAVVLSADVSDLDLEGAALQIEALAERLRFEQSDVFRDVVVRVGGQREESQRSLRSLLFAGLIAVFLVYIVMASQFESLVHPFVILFTVPLAMVGVVFTLELMALKVSVVVLIGVILLAGIVVNNAIVLVDCVNQRRRDGMDRDAALAEAGRMRLRPILMTTATTVLGLLPLAMGLGEGAEIRTPMAVTVIGGLATSTVLTLVVIPVVYSLVSRRGPLPPVTVLEGA